MCLFVIQGMLMIIEFYAESSKRLRRGSISDIICRWDQSGEADDDQMCRCIQPYKTSQNVCGVGKKDRGGVLHAGAHHHN